MFPSCVRCHSLSSRFEPLAGYLALSEKYKIWEGKKVCGKCNRELSALDNAEAYHEDAETWMKIAREKTP